MKLLLTRPPNQNLCRFLVVRNRCLRESGDPLGLQVRQCVARNADVCRNTLNMVAGGFANSLQSSLELVSANRITGSHWTQGRIMRLKHCRQMPRAYDVEGA